VLQSNKPVWRGGGRLGLRWTWRTPSARTKHGRDGRRWNGLSPWESTGAPVGGLSMGAGAEVLLDRRPITSKGKKSRVWEVEIWG